MPIEIRVLLVCGEGWMDIRWVTKGLCQQCWFGCVELEVPVVWFWPCGSRPWARGLGLRDNVGITLKWVEPNVKMGVPWVNVHSSLSGSRYPTWEDSVQWYIGGLPFGNTVQWHQTGLQASYEQAPLVILCAQGLALIDPESPCLVCVCWMNKWAFLNSCRP